VPRTTRYGDDRDEYPRLASPQGAEKSETSAAARPANGPASSGGERAGRFTSRRRRGTDIEAEAIEWTRDERIGSVVERARE